MHRIGLAALIIVGVTATGLGALRVQDIFGTGRTWHSVAEEARTRAASGGTYDTSMITDLPEPVQRYFAHDDERERGHRLAQRVRLLH